MQPFVFVLTTFKSELYLCCSSPLIFEQEPIFIAEKGKQGEGGGWGEGGSESTATLKMLPRLASG